MAQLATLAAGLLFGAGLSISNMTNPAKVQNFLDVAGTWDPSLAFVMGGALVVSALGSLLARRRSTPWWSPSFSLPTRSDIDLALVLGSALFGVGWGLGGFCPGPALAALLQSVAGVYGFVGAMLTGMVLYRWAVAPLLQQRRDPDGARQVG